MNDLIVLTRPQHRNASLANCLQNQGMDVICLPALRLRPLATQAHEMQWPDKFDLVVFVSSHAAQSYLDRMGESCFAKSWPDHVRLATVGHASAAPLYQAGYIPRHLIFHPDPESSHQDSEALWTVLQPLLHEITRVLIVRGQTGREWLGAQFEKQGIGVTRLSLYAREAEVWGEEQARILVDALKAQRSTLFLLTSSESVDAIHANMQRLNLMPQWAKCRFVAIHDRISERLHTILRAEGLAVRYPVTVCAPNDAAISEAIRLSVSSPGSH